MTQKESKLRFMWQSFKEMDGSSRVMLMMLVVGGLMFAAFFAYMGYDIGRDIPVTSLGAEVQTTDEYGQLFNDSFSGRVVRVSGLGGFVVAVRNAEGTEKKFACKWLEVADAEHEKREA